MKGSFEFLELPAASVRFFSPGDEAALHSSAGLESRWCKTRRR